MLGLGKGRARAQTDHGHGRDRVSPIRLRMHGRYSWKGVGRHNAGAGARRDWTAKMRAILIWVRSARTPCLTHARRARARWRPRWGPWITACYKVSAQWRRSRLQSGNEGALESAAP